MPIVSYTPPTKNIVDHRKPEGGYYTAKCEVCGTEFYPQRSNGKYCTANCAVINHRKKNAELLASGGSLKKSKKIESKPSAVKEIVSKTSPTKVIGASNVYLFLKKNTDTRGQKEEILSTCRECPIGKWFKMNGYEITRTGKIKYEVYEVE